MRTFVVGCPSFYPRHRHCCTFFFLLRALFFCFCKTRKTKRSYRYCTSVIREQQKDTSSTVCCSHDTRHPAHTAVSVPILRSMKVPRCNLRGHKLNVGDRDISYRYTANTVGIASLSWYPSPTIAGYNCSWARHTLWQHGRSYVAGMPSAAVLGSATGNTQLDR